MKSPVSAPSARKNPVSFGWSLNNVCKCHAHRPQLASDCQIVIYLLIAHVPQLVLQAETFGRFGSSAINRFKRLSSSTACAKHQTIIQRTAVFKGGLLLVPSMSTLSLLFSNPPTSHWAVPATRNYTDGFLKKSSQISTKGRPSLNVLGPL